MQRTTGIKEQQAAGTPADGWPYDYSPPVVSGGGQPAPQQTPRPAGKARIWSWGAFWAVILLKITANALDNLTPLTKAESLIVASGMGFILWYWVGERPRQSFLSWTLRVVGLWLNLYVGFMSAPESLGNHLPRPLAYGLPAFVVLLIFGWAAPLKPDGFDTKKSPRWQMILWAALFAALWGWAAPGAVK